MDGWLGYVDGWVSGWVDGRVGEWINGWVARLLGKSVIITATEPWLPWTS